ncbi:MAG: hypothetical protein WD554_02175 [Flavobacteriaceae bacterium]
MKSKSIFSVLLVAIIVAVVTVGILNILDFDHTVTISGGIAGAVAGSIIGKKLVND